MNAIDQSSNRLPIHTDWQRYDSPTVLRRHGLGFLERSEQLRHAEGSALTFTQEQLHDLVASFGGQCVATVDYQLLLFDDYHWAKRCEDYLIRLGLATFRLGCHIQLKEAS